jgi:hypothetical protein
VQSSLLADGTALDIDAGDAEHELAHRFPWRHERRRVRQEHATASERRGAPAIGEQAEVADADEAVGHDVEQEAAEKLVDVECHDLLPIAISIVAPAKVDVTVGEADETVVGEGDAMGVAPEIGEHMVGAGERRLAVDDPGRLAELGEPR